MTLYLDKSLNEAGEEEEEEREKTFKSCNSMGPLKWSYSVTSTCFGLCQMLANVLDSYDHFWAKYSMSDEISKNNYFY